MSPGRRPRGSGWYRAALKLAPRAHRERFGEQTAQLYDDLVRTGTPPRRLWAELPRDLLRTHLETPRPSRAVLATVTGPDAAPEITGRRRVAQRTLVVTAAATQALWLAAHLVGGYCWSRAMAAATDLFGRVPTDDDWMTYPYRTGPDPSIELWSARADALLPWLLPTFPVALFLAGWLSLGRRRSGLWMTGWAITWVVGMWLWRGYGAFAAS
ncbi:MAG: hypothetical protein IPJ14_01210 [Kineosporiaceae bacterium]|nr:hypothetical protein [Kineosporiaceae bacterium]MBK7621304.1 hypothetical protein [Kineosporiaceae bacterium]